MLKKKIFISSLSLMFALSGISATQAKEVQKFAPSKVVDLDPNNNAFLTDLTEDGYAELDRKSVV